MRWIITWAFFSENVHRMKHLKRLMEGMAKEERLSKKIVESIDKVALPDWL